MRGYKVMYGYKGKVAGMVVAGAGFLTMCIQKLTDFTVFSKLNAAQHFNILLWITIAGLYTMMFSYEKHEDERVKQIRSRSIMIVFAIMFASTLALALTVSLLPALHPEEYETITINAEDLVEVGRIMMFYPAIGVVSYLIIFHIGIYFDKAWEYNDNISIGENFRKNKLYMLLIAVASFIVIELIFHFIN